MNYKDYLQEEIRASIEPKSKILSDHELQRSIIIAMERVAATVAKGNKIFLCGNGGSATDSLHIAAEFTGKFRLNRKPYPVFSLNENIASITAIANDYGYDDVFARQLQAYGRNGDLLIALSTSGNSQNVIMAVEYAHSAGIFSVALTGSIGGHLSKVSDISICIPSDDTAHIQEAHIMLGHIFSGVGEMVIVGIDD